MTDDAVYETLKVLVVDDQPFLRMTLRHILNVLGVDRVEEACDGGEALNFINSQPFDIVFLDIDMEPVDGLQCLKDIRGHTEDEVKNTRVVMLTSHAEENIVRNLLEIGIQGYIVKPVSVSVVGTAIKRALEG